MVGILRVLYLRFFVLLVIRLVYIANMIYNKQYGSMI